MKAFLRNLTWVLFNRGPHKEEIKTERRTRRSAGYQPSYPPPGPPPQRPQEWMDDTIRDHLQDVLEIAPVKNIITEKTKTDPAYRPLRDQVKLVDAMKKVQEGVAIGSPFWNYVDEQIQKEESRLSVITDDALGVDKPKKINLLEKVEKLVAGDLTDRLEEHREREKQLQRDIDALKKTIKEREDAWIQRKRYAIPPPGPPNPLIRSGTPPDFKQFLKYTKR